MTGKYILLFYAFVLAASITSSAVESTTRQVLDDLLFLKGFELTGPTHQSPHRIETFGQSGAVPVWKVAQWNSRGTLEQVNISDRQVQMSDSCKSLTLDRKTGAINLTVNASKEYDRPRQSSSEPWVHLLLEQSPLAKPVSIAKAKAVWVEFDFELTKFNAHGVPDPGLHAAQVSWFLYLENTNPQSKGYKDFLWFGLSIFDNRHDFVPLYANQDIAMPNGSFIYTLGSQSYLKEKIVVGKRQKVRYNILPEIQKAIDAAHQRGFFSGSAREDLVFSGTNIGWEIPGMFDVGITFYTLSVEVEDI